MQQRKKIRRSKTRMKPCFIRTFRFPVRPKTIFGGHMVFVQHRKGTGIYLSQGSMKLLLLEKHSSYASETLLYAASREPSNDSEDILFWVRLLSGHTNSRAYALTASVWLKTTCTEARAVPLIDLHSRQ